MVKASRLAASQFVASPNSKIDSADTTRPSVKASAGTINPAGIGRVLVRFITASISRSYHWLMAPDAPAPAAIAKSAMPNNNGCRLPGATYMPANPVNTTRLITRGFNNDQKCPTDGSNKPSAATASCCCDVSAIKIPFSITGCLISLLAVRQRCDTAAVKPPAIPALSPLHHMGWLRHDAF